MKKFLILLLVFILAFGLISCNEEPNGENGENGTGNSGGSGTGDSGENGETNDNRLQLVSDGVASFKIVLSTSAGAEVIAATNALTGRLNSLGVYVNNFVYDTDKSAVSDCEIIIGAAIKNRPENCIISKTSLGDDKYVIKVVGKRVIIAGATPYITARAVEKFVSDILKITEDSADIENLYVDSALNISHTEKYINIAGNNILDYVIGYDYSEKGYFKSSAEALNRFIGNRIDKTLAITDSASLNDSDKKIILSKIPKSTYDGFRVRISGDDMMIECSSPELFESYFDYFMTTELKEMPGNFSLDNAYSYQKNALVVKYSDFGALGDGKTNDFFALLRAHEYANIHSLDVKADYGKTYYISYTWDKSNPDGLAQNIPVKTSVDWTGAKFYIDDKTPGLKDKPYERHRMHIFELISDNEVITYSNEPENPYKLSLITSNPNEMTIAVGQTKIDWLVPVLKYDLNYVQVTHGVHKDFIRFGNNQDSGYYRTEIILVKKDGTVDESTLPTKEFKLETKDGVTAAITSVLVKSASDIPTTITGGEFTTNVHVMGEGEYTTSYDAVLRGIRISRANVTVQDIDHKLVGEYYEEYFEGLTGTPNFNGEPLKYYCKNSPYNSFIAVEWAVNTVVRDTKLSAHIEDAEIKNGNQYKSSMGSYDLQMNSSVNISFINITQYRDITNQFYWGISASNGCKNMYFESCTLSRVDAHAGFHNMEIKDCHLGQYINLIGTGVFRAEGVTRYYGQEFIRLRNDYGATFMGDMYIIDSSIISYKDDRWNEELETRAHSDTRNNNSYLMDAAYRPNSTSNGFVYKDWDFGYICYMPENIYLDGFTSGANTRFYIFKDIEDEAFDPNNANGGYRMTKNIYYRNVCSGTNKFLGICKNDNNVSNKILNEINFVELTKMPWET